ncbi:MAG: PilZ domain-containing protein [Pseudorhodoplanes sp.]|nr:PilZ domain-containing protein [Pseudorhodoplanes sp.]
MRKDQRRHRRRSLNYPAWIQQRGGKRLRCLVADVSETGARLRISAPDSADEEFTLRLSPAPNGTRPCRVVWRSGSMMGVQFVTAAQRGTPAPTKS